MSLFTVMEIEEYDSKFPVKPVQLKHKAVAKGVERAYIKRFTYKDYVTMFREGNSRKVTHRRIGSKLHQVIYGN